MCPLSHFKQQLQWRTALKKPVNSGKTFSDISVNTGKICMEFETETSIK